MKKALVLGFAKSGYEACRLLIDKGYKVTLNDYKPLSNDDKERYETLKELGVNFVFGSHPDDLLDASYSYLVKNPGVPIDHKYVLKARELGIEVINEVEMAYRLIPKDHKYVLKANSLNIPVINEVELAFANIDKSLNAKIIGITGTNGKTTTTTLIYEMLKKENPNVLLAGNIGYPLCSILKDIKKDTIIVMEVSSQQLENLHTFNPDVAVITNIDKAHLEFFKTYEHYKYVKGKILQNSTKDNYCVLNHDDEEVLKLAENAKSKKLYFSKTNNKSTCYILNDAIYYKDEKMIDLKDIKLRGYHNYENIMAAIITCKIFNISNDTIINILKTFNGVEHRLEFVRNYNGISFYNDTEATNIKCTKIALSSFKEPTILILGGYERGQDFNELSPYMEKVKAIIAIGETKERAYLYGKSINKETYKYDTLKEGFEKIKQIMKANDVVLLSPASASWDQYNRCEERGKEFKDLVNNL